MGSSRPILIALVGAVLVATALVVTRMGGGGDPAAAPPSTAAPATSAGEPQAVQSDEAAGDPAGQSPERASRRGGGGPVEGVPGGVGRAIEDEKVVVILFSQRRAADDAATRHSIERLRAQRAQSPSLRADTAIFTESIGRLERYRAVVAGAGVSQAPSIVIVDPGRRARLLEGYTDYPSLRQHVADALS